MKEQNIVTGSLRQSSLNAYTLLAFLPPRGGTASCSPWAQAGDPCGTESSCKQRRAARPSTCRTAGVLREGFREEEKHQWLSQRPSSAQKGPKSQASKSVSSGVQLSTFQGRSGTAGSERTSGGPCRARELSHLQQCHSFLSHRFEYDPVK